MANSSLSCSAGPVDEDIYSWEAKISGPEDSPYASDVLKSKYNLYDH